jgi:hypothetical protein
MLALLSRHVQTVATDQTLSKDLVREDKQKDKFFNTLEVGKSR